MKAIVYEQYGPPEVLSLKTIEKPVPREGEVLVRVHAASVNPYDWHFLRGTPKFIRLFTGVSRPKSPRLGADCAGVVEAVGSGVARIKPGDAVFGTCKGSFAEFACGKEPNLALKPAGISFEQAASIPIAGLTALQGLRDCAKVQPRHRVLINGASGGVGTYAVQIARSMGARVTGVCSAGNAELVRSLGAEQVIDYRQEDFTRSAQKWDAIFDLVGNRTLTEFRRALQPKGVFVSCGGGGPEKKARELFGIMFGKLLIAPFVSQRLTGVLAKINTGDLSAIAAMIESGTVKPVVDSTYPLAEAAEGIRHVETGHARGKVIIAVAQVSEEPVLSRL